MDVLDHECPSCGANIPFNPKTQRWDCKYCGASYTLEDFEKYDKELKKEEEKDKEIDVEMDEYLCPNCGAKVITDKNTSATFCVYCGSTNILKNRLQGEFKPSKVIPFKNTKEEAVDKFYKFSKKKWFAPKEFCSKKNIKKVEGVYIPFWLYDCDVIGGIVANAQSISRWTSGDYEYVKTDYYLCSRDGSMTFEKVPVDGSTKFQDDIMDSIEPYDYSEMKDFNASYLSGFLAEKYDVEKDDAYSRAKSRVKNSAVQRLEENIPFSNITLASDTLNVQKVKDDYVLMPVWLLNINYKGKMQTFAMNGQTGKMVGNVPISAKKLILIALIMEVVLVMIFTLFLYVL